MKSFTKQIDKNTPGLTKSQVFKMYHDFEMTKVPMRCEEDPRSYNRFVLKRPWKGFSAGVTLDEIIEWFEDKYGYQCLIDDLETYYGYTGCCCMDTPSSKKMLMLSNKLNKRKSRKIWLLNMLGLWKEKSSEDWPLISKAMFIISDQSNK